MDTLHCTDGSAGIISVPDITHRCQAHTTYLNDRSQPNATHQPLEQGGLG